MRKRHTLYLDMDLLADAQHELSASTATETLHRALQEAVNLRTRQRLMTLDLSALTEETLQRMRENRDFASDDSPPA